ncbi:MAG: carbohydrate ABC transporter permease [Desulfurococcaceae archaeon]
MRKNFLFYFHSKTRQVIFGKIFVHLLLIIGAIMVSLPFFWMISTALKKPGTEFTWPIEWIPKPLHWENFPRAWRMLPFNRWLINTLTITLFTIIGNLLSCSLVAYGFARIDFPGRDVLFIIVLSSMMLPYPVTMIPLFLLFKSLGWIDTFKPLIVPSFFGVSAFYIFLMRQFFTTIPKEYDEAARIDGCNSLDIYRYIALPAIKPALGIVAIFSFMGSWNDFLGPLIYLSSTDRFTLALGLRFFQGQWQVDWVHLMAASLIVVCPCIILFFMAQRYYIQGIVVTGLKG